MVRKIVDDRDSVYLRLHLEPPLHAFERLQRSRNFISCNAIGSRQRCRRGSIPDVVLSRERKLEISPRLVMMQDAPESARWFESKIRDPPVRARSRTVAFHRAECLGQTALQTRALRSGAGEPVKGHDPSAAR